MQPNLRNPAYPQASAAAEGGAAARDRRQFGWTSPLVLALWAASLAATGNAWVTYADGAARRGLERSQAEAELVLEAVRAADPGEAARNLRFLLEAGLVADPGRRAALAAWLEAPGQDAFQRPPAWRPGAAVEAGPLPGGEKLIAAQFQAADASPPAAAPAAPAPASAPQPKVDAPDGIEAYGDPRLGAWANSPVPARFGRFTSGLKVGDASPTRAPPAQSQTWLADIGQPGGASWDWMARARITSLSTNSLIGGTFAARDRRQGKGPPDRAGRGRPGRQPERLERLGHLQRDHGRPQQHGRRLRRRVRHRERLEARGGGRHPALRSAASSGG